MAGHHSRAAPDGRRAGSAGPAPRRHDPAAAVPAPVRSATAWTWRLLVLLLGIYVVLRVLARIEIVVLPVVAALLATALLQPAVSAMRRRGLPRGVAVPVALAGGLCAFAAVWWLVMAQLMGSLDVLSVNVADAWHQLDDWLTTHTGARAGQVQGYVDKAVAAVRQHSQGLLSSAVTTAMMALEMLAGAVLALFTLVFFLYDGERIWAWVVRLFPRRVAEDVDSSGRRAWGTLVAYVRGTVLVALFDGVLVTVALLVIGVPLAVPLGVVVFLGAFVPLAGAFVSGGLAVLVALVTTGPLAALLTFAAILAVQQLEAHVWQPLVLGRIVRLHPLAVALSVTVGAATAGIPGAMVAVPLAAVVNVVSVHLRAPDRAASDTGTRPR